MGHITEWREKRVGLRRDNEGKIENKRTAMTFNPKFIGDVMESVVE